MELRRSSIDFQAYESSNTMICDQRVATEEEDTCCEPLDRITLDMNDVKHLTASNRQYRYHIARAQDKPRNSNIHGLVSEHFQSENQKIRKVSKDKRCRSDRVTKVWSAKRNQLHKVQNFIPSKTDNLRVTRPMKISMKL